jgi:hypothetical protein
MGFLVVFNWGWLSASLLLGLAMGWIAVVHRGQGVSKVLARWLAALVAALVAVAAARLVPGRPGCCRATCRQNRRLEAANAAFCRSRRGKRAVAERMLQKMRSIS